MAHRDEDFRPGVELFRSERLFALWSYSATYGQLLLRADQMPGGRGRLPTTIEVLFNPVDAVQIQAAYRGLVIRCATRDEATRIFGDISDDGYRSEDARVLVLESEGVTGYVIRPPMSGGARANCRTCSPRSSTRSVRTTRCGQSNRSEESGGELDIASPQKVAEAFLTGIPEGVRRERHRYLHLLTG